MKKSTRDALDILESEIRTSTSLLDGEFTSKMLADRLGIESDLAYKILKRRSDVVFVGKKKIDGYQSTVWRLK